MASILQKTGVMLMVAFCNLFSYFPQQTNGHPLKICKIDQIYQLGDSISDTGNLIRELPVRTTAACGRLPYGRTFFGKANGRCSDGLLIIDFIALAAGLPLLSPYKDLEADFTHGVNFAVAGSTALSFEALAAKSIFAPVTMSSLNVQLNWMSTYFDLQHKNYAEKLQNALFMVGEIGGNDYNFAILEEKSIDKIRSIVPDVVAAVLDAAKKVIELGAKRVVIPGNFPIGCLPVYLTAFESNTSMKYDDNGCLKQLNALATYHNQKLKQGILRLKQEYPNVIIVYGDYYKAFQFLLQVAMVNGFDTWRACCGEGGKYNYDMERLCGSAGVPVCEDPKRYVSWDGIHMTQQGYMIMAAWLLHDIFPSLHCHF